MGMPASAGSNIAVVFLLLWVGPAERQAMDLATLTLIATWGLAFLAGYAFRSYISWRRRHRRRQLDQSRQ